jgi:hypothetical protein
VQNGADVTRGIRGVEGGTTRGAHDRQAAVPAGGRQPVACSTVHTAAYWAVCCCVSSILVGRQVPSILLCYCMWYSTWEGLQDVGSLMEERGTHWDSGVMPTLLHVEILGAVPQDGW